MWRWAAASTAWSSHWFAMSASGYRGHALSAGEGPRSHPVTNWVAMIDRVMLSYWPREAAQFRYMLGAHMPAGWKMTHLSSLATNVVRADVQPVDIAAAQLQQVDPDPHPRMLGGGY